MNACLNWKSCVIRKPAGEGSSVQSRSQECPSHAPGRVEFGAKLLSVLFAGSYDAWAPALHGNDRKRMESIVRSVLLRPAFLFGVTDPGGYQLMVLPRHTPSLSSRSSCTAADHTEELLPSVRLRFPHSLGLNALRFI
jgi:hypothetical protein